MREQFRNLRLSAALGSLVAVVLAVSPGSVFGGSGSRTWTFPEWEDDTYVFLPACAYNGNRDFARSEQGYPPKFDGRQFGPSPQMVVTDIPKLEPDGSGAIEVTTGDLATPCAGFWFPKAKAGVLIFTEQQFAGFNLGYTVRRGEFVLSAPANRSKVYHHFRRHAPSSAEEPSLPAGTAFEPRVKELRFAAPDLTAFFETFFRNRKCLLRDGRSTLGFTPELVRLVHDRKNADSWREAGETGYWSPELGDNWTPGWTAGLQTAFGMCFTHGSTDALTRERAFRTVDHLVGTQTPAGLYDCSDTWAGTNATRRFSLVRRNADAIYFLLKFADRLTLKPAWRESARRACDAYVRMWRRDGDWGMFVDTRTGELVMGGTASAALVPAALAKASKLFGDDGYLTLAEEAALSYHRRFVERGISYGGPCEALLAPDSESAAALLESAVTLAEVTHKPEWIARARAAAAYLSSWIVSYRYRFPEKSEFGRLGVNTVGAVWANCQNKHAAPGLATLSGDALARLAVLTGDTAYRELFDDVVSFLPQTVSTEARPIRCWNGRLSEPGWINERVNLSDWEGEDKVGELFYGPCWCVTTFLLTAADLGLSPAAPEAAVPARPQGTRILFYADTEDYTCDESNDGIRDFARTMTEEGARVNFNIVGYLAMRIQEFGRKDVIDALKPHVLGTQSLYHSLHPTPAEYGDDPSYERSYRKALMEESAAKAMVEAVFGEGRVRFAVHPGHSMSIGNIEAKVDIGVPLGVGGFVNCEKGNLDMARPGPELDGLWYFNMYQAPYLTGTFHLEYLIPGDGWYVPPERYREIFDKLARYDLIGIGFHPHMQIKTKFWDGVNYRYGNQVKWREWNQVPNRRPEHTAAFYENLRAFVRALKADGRFRLTDFDEIERGVRPRVTIRPEHLPAIRRSLLADFNCLREPASWSVADVFQACVGFLRGAPEHRPGKVYGFLARPRGVTAPVEVSAAGLRAAAKTIDLSTFLPTEIDVEGVKIGPADFLFAALEVLTTDAERVTVTPREQLGSFKEIPSLEKFRLKGVWLHSKDFNDTYTTERFRLQLWTLRIEPVFGGKERRR